MIEIRQQEGGRILQLTAQFAVIANDTMGFFAFSCAVVLHADFSPESR